MKRPQRTYMQVLGRIACVSVSLLALGWVLRRVELAHLARTLAGANLFWMAAAAAIFGVGFALAAARWHLVLRLSNSQVHAAATFRTVLVGHLFNTLLFGPTGGDVAKSALYARWYGHSTAKILATCVLDRFLGGLGFFLFAICTPGFAIYGGHRSERLLQWATSPRVAWVAGSLILLGCLAYLLRQRFGWTSPVQNMVRAFVANAAELLRNPRLAVRGVIFSVLSHLCISCVFLFSLKAVTQTPFSLAAIFWVFPVISLITSAPVTFAGTGLRESAALFFLGDYGIPAEDAVAASLLVLFTYLIWALISGVLLWRGEARRDLARASGLAMTPQTLAVVIPTLNEAESLTETVAHAKAIPEVVEIIVVDGGSSDGTVECAERLKCRVLTGPRGRGAQLALGAARARSDVLVLLHADTWLPRGAGQALLNCLRDPLVVGGGFWKVFREKNALMLGSRFRCAVRLHLFGRVMGDQVMFIRREALERIGGVPDLPLMEEFELCRRLRAVGRLALAGATVSTSARRFAKLGVLRTYFRMWHVTARYYLGAPSHKLQKIYERK